MSGRYIGLAWVTQSAGTRAEKLAQDAAAILGLSPIGRSGSAVFLVDRDSEDGVIIRDGVVAIGDLFARDEDGRGVREITDAAARRISGSGGGDFFRLFWGDYIGVLLEEPVRVLRDPSGGAPCYYSDCGDGLTAFYSDVDFAVRLGIVQGTIDWPVLRQWLAWPAWRSAQTCLDNVRELPAGARLTVKNGSASVAQAWSPWDFADASRQFTQQRDAAEALGAVILQSTRAWVSRSASPLVELSGGLDSSIVAASLREAGANFECVNLWSPESGEDERGYAVKAAEFLNAPAHLAAMSADAFDFTDLPSTRRPRPSHHPLKRIADCTMERVAHRIHADSFFSGSGGDYVLGYLSSSAPAADALLAHGPGRRFFSAVGDVAELHACSVWKVGRLALKKAVSPPRKKSGRGEFLANAAGLAPPPPHPWTIAPRRALPGKIEHIAALSKSHGVRDGRDRVAFGPLRMPLLSQPVVETSLRIPTWMNIAGGRNRSVARDAFADRLPAAILNRRSKGTFAGLNAHVLHRHRARIAELLLGGLMRENDVLDATALERALTSDQTLSDAASSAMLEYACAELWARSW